MLLLWAAGAAPALAHGGGDIAAGFAGGFGHPLFGPDHVAAMVAVGLWGAVLGSPAIWVLPVAFPLVMAFGGVLGIAAVPMPRVEVGIAVSAIMLGLMAASGFTGPVSLAVPVALVSGLALGLDSPPESILLGEAVAMLIGTACGGIGALAMIAFVASTIARWRQRIILRVAGSWVAAIAILVLALRWAA